MNANNILFRRFIPFLLRPVFIAAIAFGVAAGPVYAIPTADPGDNSSLKPKLDGLAGSSLASMFVGLAPFWFVSIPAEIAAFGTEMGVKNTPPVFRPPADKTVSPNFELAIDGGYCKFDLGVDVRKSADAEKLYFLNTDVLWSDPSAQSVFGNLGEPYIYHPHGSVRVSADNPEILPAGRHTINWQAETRMNKILDIALPSAMLLYSGYSEKKTQDKAISSQINKLYKSGAAQGVATRAQVKAAKKIARAQLLFKDLAKQSAKFAYKLGIGGATNTSDASAFDRWMESNTFTSAKNRATQRITVWDEHPPYYVDAATTSTIEEQHLSLEATDFGGVRLGRVVGQLKDKFKTVDDCNRLMTLDLQDSTSKLLSLSESNTVTWKIHDGGPYKTSQLLASNQTLMGDDVVTELVQHITVEDTQPPLLVPPPGFSRESSETIDLESSVFPLGRPRVVDLADPRPTFSHDAPSMLEVDHRYAIVWKAEDASGNATVAPQDDPDQYTQYVTIKTPGTNTAPLADAKSAATKTAQAIEIELTAADHDIIDGRADPLEFKIKDYPPNGEFEAPLYPFFIEDFRLSPVGDHEVIKDNEIVRTSPLGDLADEFRLASESERSVLLNKKYCGNPNFQLVIPLNFVYKPTYVHVDDDGFYYVRDHYWHCGIDSSQPFNVRTYIELSARISKWNADGTLIAMRDISELSNSSTELDNDFSVDSLGWIWFSTVTRDTANNVTATRLYGMNKGLDFFAKYGEVTTDAQLLGAEDKFQDMAVNVENKVFYELRGFGFRVKELDENYETNRQLELAGYLDDVTLETYSEITANGTRAPVITHVSYNIPMTRREGFMSLPGQCVNTDLKIRLLGSASMYTLKKECPLATDIEVDSAGYVYITQRDLNRILKYAPAYQDENGKWQTGEFIGWMGDCTANRQNDDGVFYNACNELLGISQGFECTDEKCQQAHNSSAKDYDSILFTSFTGSAQPGGFKKPASIKMGPRDILYVADTENSRVQRFSADGAFGGEARSTGTGINQGDNGGFMLGNFGKPYSLSVNSSAFYVINSDEDNGDNFLHVFKTLPFYDVTDSSAKVKYVSDFNYQGSDTFSYFVDDGITTSEPASVSVNVTRAFRPPEQLRAQCYNDFTHIDLLKDEVPCRLDEDTNIVVRMLSKDPDGFISTGDGGLDTHTFNVTVAPRHGNLTLLAQTDNAAVYRYTPAADYNGEDVFSFNANDGVHDAEQEGAVQLTINPVPDPVVIDLSDNIVAARGFTRLINAGFSDVDANFQPELLYIRWGDGVETSDPNWLNSGRYDENNNEIIPQVNYTAQLPRVSEIGGRPGSGSGMLVGSHKYADTGNHTLKVFMLNHFTDGAPMEPTTATTNVEVIEATVVSSTMLQPAQPVNPDTPFEIVLEITNERPDFWAGLIARNTQVSIELPEGMSVISADALCNVGTVTDCTLGDLAVGETKLIKLSAKIDLAAALISTQFELTITLVDEGPSIQDVNLMTAGISVADEDGDSVVDVADAFPTDDRYADDIDQDGMADEWELLYALNDQNSSDAALDPDGDGDSNLEEFRNGTYPWLADAVYPADRFDIGGEGDNDQLGYRVAAGDINGDGYSDVVASAPGYQANQGAIVVYYGSAGGAQASSPVTVADTKAFGRAVAVGDLNNDNFADIAVSAEQGVYLFLGAQTSLSAAIFIPKVQPETEKFGSALLITDLDKDGLADLIVGTPDAKRGPELSVESGDVYVYRGSSGYWLDDSPAKDEVFSLNFPVSGGVFVDSYKLGDSLAVGDIDGDGLPDLLVGAAFADPLKDGASYRMGVVAGFLGKSIAWDGFESHDFILQGETEGDRFGYSLASGQDLDGDGKDDLIVGAYNNNGIGAVYLYNSTDQFWDSNFQIAPVKIQGAEEGDQFGVSVALTPVTAYSSEPAIIVGSNRADHEREPGENDLELDGAEIETDVGRVDFYSGTTPMQWLTRHGDAHAMLGYSVASAGDVNNDGESDYVIGAPAILPYNSNGESVTDNGYIQIYFAGKGKAQADEDGDLVATVLDNCPNVANTDQSNSDNDSLGDACDNVDNRSVGPNPGSSGSGGGGSYGPLGLIFLVFVVLCMHQIRILRLKG